VDNRTANTEEVAPIFDANEGTQTWYVDHEYTHGVAGMACVTNDGPFYNRAGVGPDMILERLSPKQCAGALRGMGFVELDTDIKELEEAWRASSS
jgi:hypothetical protein